MIDDVLGVLPSRYQHLFARARDAFAVDPRVRAMWLGGSLARGTADAASDLDVIIAVTDEAHGEFASSWRSWLATITPTVHAFELPFAPGSVAATTPDFARLDVVVEPVSALPTTFFTTRLVVFDPDGLSDRLPAPAAVPGPSASTVNGLILEFFRVSIPETVLVRDDWLLAREHLHHVAGLTYRLFVESNAPLPPMGVKQWSTRLTPAQRRALGSIPCAADDIDQFRRAHLAAATVFVTNAEVLARTLDIEWPEAFERAAAAHLGGVLGLEQPFPRTAEVVVTT